MKWNYPQLQYVLKLIIFLNILLLFKWLQFYSSKDFWVFQDETEEISSVLMHACDSNKNDELDLAEITKNINKFVEQQEWSNLWKFAEKTGNESM